MISNKIARNSAYPGGGAFFDIEGELNKAVRAHQSGQLYEAREIYKKIIITDPNHSDALHLLGFVAHQTGDNDTAFELITRAIHIRRRYPFYHNSLGLVFKDQGKLDEAVACYQKALELKPDLTEAHNNLGVAFHDQGKLDEAVLCYKKALEINPDIAEVYNNMGNSLKDLGRLDEALTCYENALKIRADYAEAYFNMGNTYQEMEKFNEAITCYQNAVELKQDYAEAYFNMGNAYHHLDNLEKTISCYGNALQIKPEYTEAYDNMGKTYQDMGNLERAISCYEKTLQLEPENADAHFDLSLVLLLSGNFKKGWKEYEWRFVKSEWQRTYPHRYNRPRWDGSSFPGKKLFVHAEQGLGDTIHFIRYLPMVKSLGGKVIFEAKKPLLSLFQDFPGIDELVAWSPTEKPDIDFDCYIPLLSIPNLFRTAVETIPARVPYLYANSREIEYWQDHLDGSSAFKVGLVWAGSPTNNDDRNRSCDLNNFFPLSQIPGVVLYGLQKGEATSQVNRVPEGMSITNLGEELEDFADTAGVIENLDLIISVDTATAHLAGAMGKPVWTLLPFAPDWRWLMHSQKTPWYPTMRLFRQPKRGNWAAVFHQVELELNKLVKNRPRKTIEKGRICLKGSTDSDYRSRDIKKTGIKETAAGFEGKIQEKWALRTGSNKPIFKMVANSHGWGGGEKTATRIMALMSKAGYQVHFIPSYRRGGSICAPFANALSINAVTVKKWEDVAEPCDIFFMHCNDLIWDFSDNRKTRYRYFNHIKAKRKIMSVNYEVGELGKANWTKHFDLYICQRNELIKKLKKRMPRAHFIRLHPPSNLQPFFKYDYSQRSYDQLRLIRHSSQGDRKYYDNMDEIIDRILDIRDCRIIMMPAPSDVGNKPNLQKFEPYAEAIADFLLRGNLFWYFVDPEKFVESGANCVLEAMASGLPVLCNNNGGLVDIVTKETGWICSSIDQMHDIIANTTIEEIKEKGANAREYARGSFLPNKWIDHIRGTS